MNLMELNAANTHFLALMQCFVSEESETILTGKITILKLYITMN